jgi:inhibitor of KinA
MDYTIYPLSDESILIQFGQKHDDLKEKIRAVQEAILLINSSPFHGFRELVPAYHTITIYYDPFIVKGPYPFETIKNTLDLLLTSPSSIEFLHRRFIEIPVCYDEEFALDLIDLAENNQLTTEQVIQLHTNVVYNVVFIGFLPGFPFLAGLDTRLNYPRKISPRLKVNQGSVGIAGNQTGIYPLDSPGGWQIIGRTPVKLFNVNQNPPTLFKSGDQVKFYPISKKDFYKWEEQPWE